MSFFDVYFEVPALPRTTLKRSEALMSAKGNQNCHQTIASVLVHFPPSFAICDHAGSAQYSSGAPAQNGAKTVATPTCTAASRTAIKIRLRGPIPWPCIVKAAPMFGASRPVPRFRPHFPAAAQRSVSQSQLSLLGRPRRRSPNCPLKSRHTLLNDLPPGPTPIPDAH